MHPVFHSSRNLIVVASLWLALSFIICYSLYYILDIDFGDSLILFLPLFFAFFFFCIANYFICLRLPIRRTSLPRLFITQLAGMASTLVIWLVVGVVYAYILDKADPGEWVPLFWDSIVPLITIGAILYCFWILVHYIYLMAEQHDQMERTELKQRLLISQTELQAVKATVHPHFLFNSLNTLANLSLADPRKVHDLCLKIAEFLRYSVSYGKKNTATVGEEVTHIKNYLSVENERFGSRLRVVFELGDNINEVPILPLVLFPLVENSIKHGIDHRLEGGTLSISIKKQAEMLVICIENPYDDLDKKAGENIGLESVRKRLNAHYGESSQLTTIANTNTFIVKLKIPVDIETDEPNSPQLD